MKTLLIITVFTSMNTVHPEPKIMYREMRSMAHCHQESRKLNTRFLQKDVEARDNAKCVVYSTETQ